MSGKSGQKPNPAPSEQDERPATAKPAFTGITPSKRAELRVECIKAAMIARTAQMPIKSLIVNAKEIEAYVLDPECHLPAKENAPAAEEDAKA